MYRLIYVSHRKSEVDNAELDKILEKAIFNNERAGITGCLIVTPTTFVQLLEGESNDVKSTFMAISRDRRHGSVKILQQADVSGRLFPLWAMTTRKVRGAEPDELKHIIERYFLIEDPSAASALRDFLISVHVGDERQSP